MNNNLIAFLVLGGSLAIALVVMFAAIGWTRKRKARFEDSLAFHLRNYPPARDVTMPGELDVMQMRGDMNPRSYVKKGYPTNPMPFDPLESKPIKGVKRAYPTKRAGGYYNPPTRPTPRHREFGEGGDTYIAKGHPDSIPFPEEAPVFTSGMGGQFAGGGASGGWGNEAATPSKFFAEMDAAKVVDIDLGTTSKTSDSWDSGSSSSSSYSSDSSSSSSSSDSGSSSSSSSDS